MEATRRHLGGKSLLHGLFNDLICRATTMPLGNTTLYKLTAKMDSQEGKVRVDEQIEIAGRMASQQVVLSSTIKRVQ